MDLNPLKPRIRISAISKQLYNHPFICTVITEDWVFKVRKLKRNRLVVKEQFNDSKDTEEDNSCDRNRYNHTKIPNFAWQLSIKYHDLQLFQWQNIRFGMSLTI